MCLRCQPTICAIIAVLLINLSGGASWVFEDTTKQEPVQHSSVLSDGSIKNLKPGKSTPWDRLPEWASRVTPVNTDRGNWTSFVAYDCTQPQFVHKMYLESLQNCPEPDDQLVTYPREYLVLQKRKSLQLSGWTCRLTRVELGSYCGHADHMTLSLDQMTFDDNILLSEELCLSIVNKRQYCVGELPCTTLQFSHSGLTGTVKVKYHRAGSSFYTATDVGCEGQTVKDSQGVFREGFVLYTHDTVEIKRVIFTVDKKGIMHNRMTKIGLDRNCKIYQKTCIDNGLRYIWTVPVDSPETCNTYSTKRVKGVVHFAKDVTDAKKVFIATDGTMASFVLGKTLKICNTLVFTTDFDTIFLADASAETVFPRITARDIDVDLNTAVKLAFTRNTIYNYTQTVYRTVMQEACLQRERKIQNYPLLAASQLAFSSGQTVSLSPGTFATGDGEVIYRYYCSPVIVQGLQSHHTCYNALPVVVPPEIIPRFKHLLEQEQRVTNYNYSGGTGFWIEPHSHRLVVSAVEKPCTKMPAHYQNVNGMFVGVGPDLFLPPKQPIRVSLKNQHSAPAPVVTDYSQDAIYSGEQLRSFVAATYAGRQRFNVQTRLVDEIRGENPKAESIPLLAVSRVFGIGSSAVNILQILFVWTPYIVVGIAFVASYSWIQNCCACGYRYKLLKNSITKWTNCRVWCALCCPHLMTQHSAPGKRRPLPIFSYKKFKERAQQRHATTPSTATQEANFAQSTLDLADHPSPRPTKWRDLKNRAFKSIGFVPMNSQNKIYPEVPPNEDSTSGPWKSTVMIDKPNLPPRGKKRMAPAPPNHSIVEMNEPSTSDLGN